jgi:WS/DGAT/MGAT family acyltransferase
MGAVKEEPLSRAAAWLHAEEPTNPFVVTSLAVLDEPLDLDRFKSMLSRRIHLHPRLRQVVNEGLVPVVAQRWTTASNFDLDAHIRRVALPPPGGHAELAEFIGDLVGRPLDFGQPLWEIHAVNGPGRGGALVSRFHHSLGDGQAMVRMLMTLTDVSAGGWKRAIPGSRSPRRRARHPRPRMVRDAARLVGRLREAPGAARKAVDAAGTLARLTLLDGDRQTTLRGDLTNLKRVAWSRPIPLAVVKRVAKASGTTVNDVIVSAIAGGLGIYLRQAGEDTRGLRIRAMVPVDLRPAGDSEMSGNRFSLVYLELPVGVWHPDERLMRVKIEMDRIKASMEPAVGWLLVRSLGLLPAWLEHIASTFYADKASLVLTNVIGPAQRIYIAGSPMRQMTFWEPESGGLGVGISTYSYAGEVTIAVVSDRNLIAHPDQVIDGVAAAMSDLIAKTLN